MVKSHNKMALTIITGIIFSTAGFVLANVSGLNPENKNTVAIAKNRNKE
jgi:hypothetical protein